LTGVLGAAALAIRSTADTDDVNVQIDVIGVPWLMLGFESLAAQKAAPRASE